MVKTQKTLKTKKLYQGLYDLHTLIKVVDGEGICTLCDAKMQDLFEQPCRGIPRYSIISICGPKRIFKKTYRNYGSYPHGAGAAHLKFDHKLRYKDEPECFSNMEEVNRARIAGCEVEVLEE